MQIDRKLFYDKELDFRLSRSYGPGRYDQNYEEKGRLFLATRGQITHVVGTQKPIVVGSAGDIKDLAAFINSDWNAVHVIA